MAEMSLVGAVSGKGKGLCEEGRVWAGEAYVSTQTNGPRSSVPLSGAGRGHPCRLWSSCKLRKRRSKYRHVCLYLNCRRTGDTFGQYVPFENTCCGEKTMK
jgi:hypothetical protein